MSSPPPAPAQVHELGQSIAQWKVRSNHSLANYTWAMLLRLLGTGIILYNFTTFLYNEDGRGVRVCFCGSFGLIILGLAIAGGIKAFWERDLQMRTFTDDLIYTRAGQHKFICWNDIAAVWQDITNYKAYGVVTTHTTR